MIESIELDLTTISQISKLSISIFSSTVLVGIINILIRKWLDLKYSEKLEKFKQNLKIVEKELENEFRKKISNYEIYIDKRHHALSLIYENLLRLEGNIYKLYGLRELTDYRSIPTLSLISLVNDKVRDESTKNIIIEFINSGNLDEGIKQLEIYFRNKEFFDARISRIEFGNSILSNKLYLPNNVDKKLELVYNGLNTILLKFEHNHFHNIRFENEEIETMKKEIENQKVVLIKIMKSSLSGNLE